MDILTLTPFTIDLEHLHARLRVRPGSRQEQELHELTALANAAGRPKAAYVEQFIEDRQGDTLTIGGERFSSRQMRLNLEPVDKVFAYVVTAGVELDQALDEKDMLRDFYWDAIKEEILGSAIHLFDDTLRRRHGMPKTATMNPGSGDVDVWPIEQQAGLFRLLGDGPERIGVRLGETFLMSPVKTVSGILFATEKDFRTCQVCRREGCPNRQAAFDQAMWEALR